MAKMPNTNASDIAELAASVWASEEYLRRDNLKRKRQEIAADHERRGIGNSGPRWSSEVDLVLSHARQLVEACLDRLADGDGCVARHERDEVYWTRVEGVILPSAKQFLRGALGAIEREAKVRGAGGGVGAALMLQEGQGSADIAHRIQTRIRGLALRDRLASSSQERAVPPQSKSPSPDHGKYDVALSFAGEDREYVNAVAQCLNEAGIQTFYDGFEEVGLWGKDLYAYLNAVYRDRATYCVMFLSAHYARKAWTNHERKAAQARAFNESREYILPAKFDDTEIPGVNPTVGYIDLRDRTPAQLAELQKVRGDAPNPNEPTEGANPTC